MKQRRSKAIPSQRGFALIAILALVALIAAFLISSGLSRSNADISNEREQHSMAALRQAKVALIAYAAAVDYRLQGSGSSYLQPGALPCPDMDGDGDSDCIGSTTASMIGRFPWQTVGTDDLRDASGEQIWYAVSHDFRKQQCTSQPDAPSAPSGCTKINSDTQGQLSVTGAQPASNVVAVLIAPGIAIKTQVRPNNTASNYVESFLAGDGVHFSFTTNALPDQNNNDRILVITQQELMAAVEPVVAARIEKDIAPLLQSYYNLWGHAYPFPAPFAGGAAPSNPGRAQAEYKGITAQPGPPPVLPEVSGLLPVTTAAGFLTWSTSSISIVQIRGGTGTGTNGPSNPANCTWPGGSGGAGCTITSVDCSNSTSSQINCRIDYALTNSPDDRPAIMLFATLQNAALSFPKPLTGLDPTMTDKNGNPVQLDPSGVTGAWSWSDVPTSTPTFFAPTVGFIAKSDGSADLTFKGRLQNQGDPPDGTGGRVRLRISIPSYDVITSADRVANPDTAWFIANEWFRQTYYAVSAGVLPGNGGTCTNYPTTPPLPSLSSSAPFYCLKVNNLRPSYTTNNDKLAILMLAGRSLTSNIRPTGNVSDYFENANGTSPFVYENRVGLPTSINDRVVVVSP